MYYIKKNNKSFPLVILIFLLVAGLLPNGNITGASFVSGAAPAFKINGNTLVSYNGKQVSVTVPSKAKKIGKRAFAGKPVKKVIIKKGLKSIQPEAFKDCTRLRNIQIPVSVTKISASAFKGCKNVIINAPEGSYALKFAKKHKFNYKITGNKNNKVSAYNITGIECYWYTAGVFPCTAQKKTVTDSSKFDSIYTLLQSLNSGEKLTEDDIMVNGGQTLRVIIHFSGKEDLQAECNQSVYIENGEPYRVNSSITPKMFWEQVKEETIETEL